MLILPLLLSLAAGTASAKGAADWFHGSSHKYVAGRHQEALVQAEEGLRLFPGDPALKTLVAHLRRLKDQQRQDQGSQGSSGGDQGKDEKDKQDKQAGDRGGGEGEQEKKDQEGKQGEDEGQGKEDGRQDPGEESRDPQGGDSAGQARAPVKPGEMSKEDAERLLNSIQDDEKKEHRQQQKRWRKRPEVEQDW
jgi:hypothetical protein